MMMMVQFDLSTLMYPAMVELATTPTVAIVDPSRVIAPPQLVADWDLTTLRVEQTLDIRRLASAQGEGVGGARSDCSMQHAQLRRVARAARRGSVVRLP